MLLAKFLGTIVGVIIVLALLALFSIIGAIPLYFLWNWLMPVIFAIKEVTFSQAWGLLFLTSILFKNSSK